MKKITVYGRDDKVCKNCRVVGQYLRRLSTKMDLEITKIDVDEDVAALELLRSKGYLSVPIIVVGDEWIEYVGGVPTVRIERALEAIND